MVKIHKRNEYGGQIIGAEAPKDQKLHGLHGAGYLLGARQPLQARLVWLNDRILDHHNRRTFSPPLALRHTKFPGHPWILLVFRT